jgi:uncharacterized protein (TIGR03089 family)
VPAAVGRALGPNEGREVGEALEVCREVALPLCLEEALSLCLEEALSRHARCATTVLRTPAGELSTVGSTPARATDRTSGATGWAVAAGALMTGRALNAGTARPSSRTVGALRMEGNLAAGGAGGGTQAGGAGGADARGTKVFSVISGTDGTTVAARREPGASVLHRGFGGPAEPPHAGLAAEAPNGDVLPDLSPAIGWRRDGRRAAVLWPAMSAHATTPATLLAGALHGDPSRVLLTHYDDATGERAELSVATFANWVAKTANLCRDDLDLELGARVAIALPLHWQAAVWWQACWESGFVGVAAAPGEALPSCDVAVVALDGAEGVATLASSDTDAISDVVGLGLGPMGLPVPGRPVPPGITVEFDREVHAHGDRFAPPGGLSTATAALSSAAGERSAGELAQLALAEGVRWVLSTGDRALLARPYDDERSLLAGLLVPLAAGSAAVLCRNLDRLDEQALARRIAAEGVTVVTDPLARFLSSQPRHLE